MSDAERRIAENLADVRARIATAAQRSGRPAEAVTLVAITKSMPAAVAAAVVDAGCANLGESRPQELWTKSAALAGRTIDWHLIGHLQRNKIRRTLPLLKCIHSIDSARLLAALNEEAAACGKRQQVLLEVNISLDITKTGIAPEELEPLLHQAASMEHVAVCGLMAMASSTGGSSAAQRDFAAVRLLRDRLAQNCPPGVTLSELSMGMSGDYEVAVAEGATLVRVGSALFEGVDA